MKQGKRSASYGPRTSSQYSNHYDRSQPSPAPRSHLRTNPPVPDILTARRPSDKAELAVGHRRVALLDDSEHSRSPKPVGELLHEAVVQVSIRAAGRVLAGSEVPSIVDGPPLEAAEEAEVSTEPEPDELPKDWQRAGPTDAEDLGSPCGRKTLRQSGRSRRQGHLIGWPGSDR